MTEKKEANRLERLSSEDLLLDFHNFEEFNKKLNYYLTSTYKHKKELFPNKDKTELIKKTYFESYTEILTLLSILDYRKYQELYNKYDSKINNNNDNLKKLEQIYSELLTEYASYILPLSNKKITKDTLLQAAINTKKSLNTYNEDQLNILKENLTTTYEMYESKAFPYIYDPNNSTSNYLESKSSKTK